MEIVLKAKICSDLVTFQAMGDCILRAQSIPGQSTTLITMKSVYFY